MHIIRLREVMVRAGLLRSTVYRLIESNDFPRQIKLTPGARAAGWPADEVDQWIHDRLFPAEEAAELTMRAELLRGLQIWLETAGTQTAAAKLLGVTQARVSDIKRGKIGSFSLDLLVRLAARAGMRPKLRFAA